MNEVILNQGLALALEWGDQWLQPIQEGLGASYPSLSRRELDEYDALCKEAMTYGHTLVPRCWRKPGQNEQQAFADFKRGMGEKYRWISEENLSRIYSQGMYYAWKNGEIPV